MKEGNPIFSREFHLRNLRTAIGIVATTYLATLAVGPAINNAVNPNPEAASDNGLLIFPCDENSQPIENPQLNKEYVLCLIKDGKIFRGTDAFQELTQTPSPQPAPAPSQ